MHIISATAELWIAWSIVTVVVLVGMVWIRKDQKRQIRRALHSTESSLKEHSRREAEVLTRSARMLTREETKRLRDDLENTIGAESEEIRQREKRLEEREALLDRQLQTVLENESRLKAERETLDALKVELTEKESTANRLIDEHKTALSGVTGLSEDEAKERFFEIIRNEFSMEASQLGKGIIEEVEERAEEDARRLIGLAIQR